MHATPVILIFDIGKTNKKLLLFDETYNMVYELIEQFQEIKDEDGFSGEDLYKLKDWMLCSFADIMQNKAFDIKAINFSGYGASFVLIDDNHKEITPLYNYLKPYDKALQAIFYQKYGGEQALAKVTASPILGNLNSGMQLYRIKNEQPSKFEKLNTALHLPQYLSFLFTQQLFSDITSIGCHTHLWNFNTKEYHSWVKQEGIFEKLAPIKKCNEVIPVHFSSYNKQLKVGIGIHDSSAALVPYIHSFQSPYVLISTGTWSISLNPFNHSVLTDEELKQDCLCFLSYEGNPIKASRLFAGNKHEQQIKKLSEKFNKPLDDYKSINFNPVIYKNLIGLNEFVEDTNYEDAYHKIIFNIIQEQTRSTNLVLKNADVDQIFVDGGFSSNPVFMHMLAAAYPNKKVFAATLSQASSLGAAMAIHANWNSQAIPKQLIQLKQYFN
ncbi:MAG: FGGY-family carbohydrate kinase [Sediminibacterium sp.]